jgi:hypothetical protein
MGGDGSPEPTGVIGGFTPVVEFDASELGAELGVELKGSVDSGRFLSCPGKVSFCSANPRAAHAVMSAKGHRY